MSGQPTRNPLDAAKFRNAYMANLSLRADLDDVNLQANKVYKRTGQLPAELTDNRTSAERLRDVLRLRTEIRSKLREIADGEQTEIISNQLTNREVIFYAQNAPLINSIIRPRYAQGILADIFIPYLQRYMSEVANNGGISSGLQQNSGSGIILNGANILGGVADLRSLALVKKAIQPSLSASTDRKRPADIVSDRLNIIGSLLPSPQLFIDVNSIKDAVLKNTLKEGLNNAMRSFPTKNEMKILVGRYMKYRANNDRNLMNRTLDEMLQSFTLPPEVAPMIVGITRTLYDTLRAEKSRGEDADAEATRTRNEDLARRIANNLGVEDAPDPDDGGSIRSLDSVSEAIADEARDLDVDDELSNLGDVLESELTGITTDSLNVGDASVIGRLPDGLADELSQVAPIFINTPNVPETEASEVGDDSLDSVSGASQFSDGGAADADAPSPPTGGTRGVARASSIPLSTRIDASNVKDFNKQPLINWLKGIRQSGAEDLFSRFVPATSQTKFSKLGANQLRAVIIENADVIEEAQREVGLVSSTPVSTSTPSTGTPSNIASINVSGKGMRGSGVIGIRPTERFVPFGRYVINNHRLNNDVVAIKRPAGSCIKDFPSCRVSPKLGKVIRKIVGGNIPAFEEFEDLNDNERNYLYKIAKSANILERLSIPAPNKDEEEQMLNQFEIMKGEIIAGNDNKEMIKKFKILLMKLAENKMLPKSQVRDILFDLTNYGF